MTEPNYTRADFFRVSLRSTLEVVSEIYTQAQRAMSPLSTPPAAPPRPAFVRPPGAGSEAEFLAACTSCNDCILACPHHVIRKAGPELGAKIAGTPVILPSITACLMCEDLPCVAACETSALKPPEGAVKIGVAVVDPALCYSSAHQQDCNYCRGPCPPRPRAIRVPGRGELPLIDTEACTGCGKCAVICPADALRIEPLGAPPAA